MTSIMAEQLRTGLLAPVLMLHAASRTGIKVTYDVYDSSEVLETKPLTGGSGYDVVVPAGSVLERNLPANVFPKLDTSKLPNLATMDPEVMRRTAVHDPGVAAKLADCGIAMLDAPHDVLSLARIHLGFDVNSETPVEVAYAIPREGAPIWFDMVAIPADAPHPENAHALLDYLMDPEVAAGINNLVQQPTGSAAAVPFVDERIANDPAV
jgi:putrescine transport system substrate-binding protein